VLSRRRSRYFTFSMYGGFCWITFVNIYCIITALNIVPYLVLFSNNTLSATLNWRDVQRTRKSKTEAVLPRRSNNTLSATLNWRDVQRTRKSKTEAVLPRRSMLKLGVICKFMQPYGKCLMSWNVHLEFQVLCLGGVIVLLISGILGVYAILATFCSLFSSVSK